MNNKPKVLIIDNSIDVTGALKSIVTVAKDLSEYFEFQFIIPKNSKARCFIEDTRFTRIYELPMRELSRTLSTFFLYIPYLFLNAFRLKRIINENSISVIHVNDIYNLLPMVIRLMGNKTPYICHIRFLPDRFPAWLFNFWFKLQMHYSFQIIAVSKCVLDQLQKGSKVMVIYDGLPLERYPELITLDKSKSNFTFLYVANFIKGKGQDFAIEAFARIHQHLPDWNLRFVGGDMGLKKNIKYKNSLKEKANQLGVYNKTVWMEFTKEVEFEYKRADIVLNFSESESFSMTCLEALFLGRPLIATDCGGPSEIIDNEQTGILVPNRDIEAMAAAMERLTKNAFERNEMGSRASQRVKQKFNKENTSMRLKNVYDEILLA